MTCCQSWDNLFLCKCSHYETPFQVLYCPETVPNSDTLKFVSGDSAFS